VSKRLSLFLLIALLVWVIVAYPAYRLGSAEALVYSVVALGLCLIPTAGTLAWSLWNTDPAPEQQLLVVLGGTGVRMGFVLGGSLILFHWVPYFQQEIFWLWVLGFFLFTLALETILIVSGQSAASRS
jgi:hypothetical protein